jgi:hypothetical protein
MHDTRRLTLKIMYKYRFTYKDAKGVMGSEYVFTDEKDSELAIAQFEKKHPHLVWRAFSFVK